MRKLVMLMTGIGMLLGNMLYAQSKEVAGKVTDPSGSPIPGATIKVKGTKSGTSAESDGSFRLAVSEKSNSLLSLVISAVGYETKEVNISRPGPVAVQLATDTRALSEVVVTGVGVATDKRKVAISVESISSDKLPATPTASVDQALVGKIAGATISSASGNPGSGVAILLRGINTLQGGTSPLIMIDGVEMGSTALQALDLNTVDRVEVVQGAASATIYGAQGANGVIQIFTKKGRQGPTRIDISSRISFDQPLNIGNLHQPYNHSFITDANGIILDNNGNPLKQDALGIWGETTWLNTGFYANNKPYKGDVHYYDHIKQLFRNVKTINNSITLSGGKEKSDYALSASNITQESVIHGKLSRSNLTANFGFEVFKNFKLRFTNQFILSNSDIGTQSISAAVFTYPFADFTYKDADGNSTLKFGGAGANARNPLYYFEYEKPKNVTLDVVPSINANYKVNRFLELDYKYGINYSRSDNQYFVSNQEKNKSSQVTNSYIGQSLAGSISQNLSRFTNQNSLVTATVKLDFANDFHLNVPIISTTQGAFDWRKKKAYTLLANFVGLPQYEPVNGAQANLNNASEYETEFVTYGYYVNQRFEYRDIAGISGGFRSDYSSTFGSGSKPFTFPRGDAYFRISKLGFWDNLSKVFPEFKLRAAYGEAGVQPGVFDRIITLRKGSFDNASWLAASSQAANPALDVEVSKELEAGADMVFNIGKDEWFPNIRASFTYWNRKSDNVIFNQDQALSTGISSYLFNSFGLSSHGEQFSIDASVYSSKNVTWNLTTAFGKQMSKIERIANKQDVLLPFGSINYVLKEGQRLGTVYGYKAVTSFDMKDPQGNLYIPKSDVGKYQIVNGVVTDTASKTVRFTSDKYPIGNTDPKFTLSFTNSIGYKDYFTLSFQFDWFYGAKRYNQTKEWMYSEGLHGDYDKPVIINNVTLPFTAFYKSYYDAAESNGTKDFFFEDATFLRLRNVALGFDFAKFFRMKVMNKLQLVLSGRNLWTVTKYTGMDPESTSGGTENSSYQRGADQFSFPNFKSYQVGVNVGF
jgi:TonB-linked SusC/RagA family outer membrane protein